MNDSIMNKSQGGQTQFSPQKKTLEKGKWICYCLSYSLSAIILIDRLINQLSKKNFHLSQNIHHAMENKY